MIGYAGVKRDEDGAEVMEIDVDEMEGEEKRDTGEMTGKVVEGQQVKGSFLDDDIGSDDQANSNTNRARQCVSASHRGSGHLY